MPEIQFEIPAPLGGFARINARLDRSFNDPFSFRQENPLLPQKETALPYYNYNGYRGLLNAWLAISKRLNNLDVSCFLHLENVDKGVWVPNQKLLADDIPYEVRFSLPFDLDSRVMIQVPETEIASAKGTHYQGRYGHVEYWEATGSSTGVKLLCEVRVEGGPLLTLPSHHVSAETTLPVAHDPSPPSPPARR